jgi:hypothetical protein
MNICSDTRRKAGCKKYALCTKYGSGNKVARLLYLRGVGKRITVGWDPVQPTMME